MGTVYWVLFNQMGTDIRGCYVQTIDSGIASGIQSMQGTQDRDPKWSGPK